MASESLTSLLEGLAEVRVLQRADSTPSGSIPQDPELTRAICRAGVVILSSHLEAYIRGVNLEMTEVVNRSKVDGTRLPQMLRLVHARPMVLEVADTQWDIQKRATKLIEFMASEGWLWEASSQGKLTAERMVMMMKSPKPKEIERYYKQWGIDSIFRKITRSDKVKASLYLRIGDLVDKRNAIAHGDRGVDATQGDIRAYAGAVSTFAERADRALAKQAVKLCGCPEPW